MKKEYSAPVCAKRMLNTDTAYITLLCPEIALSAVPGQFVNISCSHFLKRPFGIASVDKVAGTISVGIKVVGEGTAELSNIKQGDTVNVLGPLGNGFDFSSADKYILVAGGTGVFPINFAHEILSRCGKPHVVVEGFRNKDQIVLYSPEYILTTDAGDAGIHGNCCDGLNTLSDEQLNNAQVLCVGPLPMMKAVGNWARSKGLKCYVSMEQRMACGIGICLVCVCKVRGDSKVARAEGSAVATTSEGEEFSHVRCCKDGPVFDFEEVIW